MTLELHKPLPHTVLLLFAAYSSLLLTIVTSRMLSKEIGKPWPLLPELKSGFGREFRRKILPFLMIYGITITLIATGLLFSETACPKNDLLSLSLILGSASLVYTLFLPNLGTLLYPVGLALGIISSKFRVPLPLPLLLELYPMAFATVLASFAILAVKYRHLLAPDEKVVSFLEDERERRRYELLAFLSATTIWMASLPLSLYLYYK